MSKIVLIAYKSDKDSDVAAVLQARGILIAQMTSTEILERFEIFDVVDSLEAVSA
jgi:spore coat polysaccharide biosynthesis protein SpsF (cytidylyltransferase family)